MNHTNILFLTGIPQYKKRETFYHQHTPTQSIVVCCSHKVVAVEVHTPYYVAKRRGMNLSARIINSVFLLPVRSNRLL
ncbi:MAG: hypothetical protein ACTTI6_07265, partial [Treponema sp.]